jgi:transcriptional regulator with XRE-family HTH domain
MPTQPIPNSLRKHRKAAGLRQLDVAHLLGLESTDRISRWENGIAVPHLENAFKLAALYHVSLHDLYQDYFSSITEMVHRSEKKVCFQYLPTSSQHKDARVHESNDACPLLRNKDTGTLQNALH